MAVWGERFRSRLAALLPVAVSAALLALVLRKVEFADLWDGTRRLPTWAWATAVAIVVLSLCLDAVRTALCARLLGRRVRFWIALHMNLVSSLYGFLLFGWVGGGSYRLWRLTALGFETGEAVALLLLDRASVIVVAGVVFGSLVLVRATISAELALSVVWSGVALMLPLGLWSFASLRFRLDGTATRTPKGSRWNRLCAMLRLMLAGGWAAPAAFLALGVISLAPGFAWACALARLFGAQAPGPTIWSEMAALSLAQQVPLAFAGIGVREYGYQWLFERWGGDPAGGTVVGAVGSLLIFAVVSLGALARIMPIPRVEEVKP